MEDSGQSGMSASTGTQAHERDTQKLHELGYAQELSRKMGAFSNFAVSFTIISILSGALTLYHFAMITGGPIDMNIGWPLVGILVTLVGLSMAEVCSSYPTAGGLYYWSAKLAKKNGPAWSWFTGWFNLMGQIGITAGIDFGLALFVQAFLHLAFNYSTSRPALIVVYAVVLFLHGLLNTFGVRLVAFLNDVSVWWHIIGVLVIVGILFILPDKHASWGYTFFHFENQIGFKFPGATLYVFLVGMLLAQYTFTGYDASAHMTEETTSADVSGPRGIVMSIVVSLVAGWILLIGVTHAIDPAKYNDLVTAPISGLSPVDIWITATTRHIAEFMLLITIGAQFYCGMSSVTANSRMIYAFSRDGALPGSKFWHNINKRTRTPTNSIWLAAVGAFILGLPYLYSAVAYFAVTSIAVIGLYIAYAIPIYLRLRAGDDFRPGPWNLGKKTYVIGWISVIWVIFITILFVLPQFSPPFVIANFNYASVATAVVFFGAGGWWVFSAKNWFKGPKVQGTPEELAAIERELESV